MSRAGVRPLVLPASLVLGTGMSVVTAAVLRSSILGVVVGAALVAAYWGLEALFTRLGQAGSFGHGLLVGLGGMVVRLAVVVGGLLCVGLLAPRQFFLACVLSFVGLFTLTLVVHLSLLARQVGRPVSQEDLSRHGGSVR